METRTVFDYYSETYELPDGSFVNCEIMDTGGQEVYDSQNRMYYRRADCCLLVYDITNKSSFDAIEQFYVKEISNYCKKDIQVILLGNKTDLDNKRVISKKEGTNLATKYNFCFKETSCVENSNVRDAFETLIIMTNTKMKKLGKINLGEKENIETFKLNYKENEYEGFSIIEENRRVTIKNKNKKDCC